MRSQSHLFTGIITFLVLGAPPISRGDDSTGEGLAALLRRLDGRVIPAQPVKDAPNRMLAEDVRQRLRAADQRENGAWTRIHNRADWTRYRDARLAALRASLGSFPPVPRDLHVKVTGRRDGDGYRIENLVFQSRPGVVVTANLYVPARPGRSMPGILVCHSHHNPKTQAELQDMGMTWARLGCYVLVMEQLGHGERRQHPFVDARSYPQRFAVGRQDYYFRYNVGMQLHLVGESLIGWMVWDLMRGVDLLLARPGIDPKRIILLGAVAGGGDPAAVAGALDRRIAVVVPFNFGGPQPETTYPLPASAERSFRYAGSGSWESTRNLRRSARDGFLPWVIVGAIAPRGLIYAHEFAWDRAHDPVWARLEKIYQLHGRRERLAGMHGRGRVTGRPPESTHCNNIGPEHRRMIYPILKDWMQIPVPDSEYHQRRPARELMCLTPAATRQFKPRAVHQLAAELASERTAAARKRLAALDPDARRRRLRLDWERVLGEVQPAAAPRVTSSSRERLGPITVERVVLTVERTITVPVILLLPAPQGKAKAPVVVGLGQAGKAGFLKERSEALSHLLRQGVAVCLPDLRGTGETSPGGARGRTSAATAISSSELMLGQSLVGSQLKDLLSVLHYLRTHPALDGRRIALWGDSFASVNPPDRRLDVPLDAAALPASSEPLGGLLALLGGLFDPDVRAVAVRGGLGGYQSALESPFCYVPHDVIVPGVLTVGDLSDVAAALAPLPLRLERLVDGRNRLVGADEVDRIYEPARAAYRSAKAWDRFWTANGKGKDENVAEWLNKTLK
jgi:cephalosporin-C deacetylase-like acetyl esterase